MKQGRKNQKIIVFTACAAVILASVTSVIFNRQPVSADYLCVSARCLEAEAAEATARNMQAEAAAQKGSYQAEVNRYQAEIAAAEAAISRTEEEIAELTARIENTEKKIGRLRESIKSTVVKLYLNNNVSELELLASAESYSDFQTKSAQQEIISGKLKQLALDAKAAKAELEKEKLQLEIRQKDNEKRRADNVALRAEQQAFVDKWQGDENAWAAQAKTNQNIKNEEREKQRKANANLGLVGGNSACGGGYPYCGYPQDSMVDPWGMYNRECVSYAAWKVQSTYGNMPYWGGHGNANQWINNAYNAGIPVSSEPKAGTVGISTAGYYGHAVWVEQVSGDKIYISQYNAAMNGMYSEQWVGRYTFTYLYFGDW